MKSLLLHTAFLLAALGQGQQQQQQQRVSIVGPSVTPSGSSLPSAQPSGSSLPSSLPSGTSPSGSSKPSSIPSTFPSSFPSGSSSPSNEPSDIITSSPSWDYTINFNPARVPPSIGGPNDDTNKDVVGVAGESAFQFDQPTSLCSDGNPKTQFRTNVFSSYRLITSTNSDNITLSSSNEMRALENGFIRTYNTLQTNADSFCDPFMRRIETAIIHAEDATYGPVMEPLLQPTSTMTTIYRYAITGSCCGCDSEADLFFHAYRYDSSNNVAITSATSAPALAPITNSIRNIEIDPDFALMQSENLVLSSFESISSTLDLDNSASYNYGQRSSYTGELTSTIPRRVKTISTNSGERNKNRGRKSRARRKVRRTRRLQSTRDSCTTSAVSGQTLRPPTEEEMKSAFQVFVEETQATTLSKTLFKDIKSILTMDEVEATACDPRVKQFSSTIFVDVMGSRSMLQQLEMEKLGDFFATIYNSMADAMCDPMFRRVQSVVVSRGQVIIKDGYQLQFDVTGLCRDCAADSFLFAPSCGLATPATATPTIPPITTRVVPSPIAGKAPAAPPAEVPSTVPSPSRSPVPSFNRSDAMRKLQTSVENTCYCIVGAKSGIPCEEDLQGLYNALVQSLDLPSVQGIASVIEEVRTLTPSELGTREPTMTPSFDLPSLVPL